MPSVTNHSDPVIILSNEELKVFWKGNTFKIKQTF